MLGNAVSSPYAATAAGAGAGLAGTYAARSAGQAVFDKARGSYPMKQPIPNLNQQAVDLSTARAGMEGGDSKSFLSRIFDLGKNKAKNTDLSKTEALKHLVKENDSTIFPQKYDPYSTVSNANSKTKIMDMLGAAGVDNQPSQPGLFDKIKSKLFGATATQPATHQQIKAQQILKELGSPKMTALKQYGGNALKGGVIGAATSGIANAGMKGYLNAKYDDDQLKLWNELAK